MAKSAMAITTEIRNLIFEELKNTDFITQKEVCEQTGKSKLTFYWGKDENGADRFASIEVTAHMVKMTKEVFNEKVEEYEMEVEEKAKKKAAAEKEKTKKIEKDKKKRAIEKEKKEKEGEKGE